MKLFSGMPAKQVQDSLAWFVTTKEGGATLAAGAILGGSAARIDFILKAEDFIVKFMTELASQIHL